MKKRLKSAEKNKVGGQHKVHLLEDNQSAQ